MACNGSFRNSVRLRGIDYSGSVQLPMAGALGPRKHRNKLPGSTDVEKFLHQPREYQLLKITYAQSLAYNRGTRTL